MCIFTIFIYFIVINIKARLTDPDPGIISIQPTRNDSDNENICIHRAICNAFGFGLICFGVSDGHTSALDTIRETVDSVLY